MCMVQLRGENQNIHEVIIYIINVNLISASLKEVIPSLNI
jgi:hypothetical protein